MKRLQKIAFVYLLACVFFLWGFATQRWQVFPHNILVPAVESLQKAVAQQRERGAPLTDALILHPQEVRNTYGRSGYLRHDPAFQDDGYLLISRFSGPHNQGIVELFSLQHGKALHTWVPDLREILRRTPKHQTELNTFRDHRAQHPLMLPGGDLIVKNSEGPMARVRPDGSVVWTLDLHFHHSLELDPDGNIVVPIVLTPPQYRIQENIYPYRDDGIAWVSPDGKLLRTVSMMDLLLDAGRRDLVFGIGPWEGDRFHLNDCDPVFADTGDTLRGDILLSIRNLSAVALYRPSENRLVWTRTGPWLNQHDISLLPDGRFSIFGNDVLRFVDRGQVFINPDGPIEVYLLDAATGAVETPWTSVLRTEKVRSITQGRSRVLDNGDVFVEATDTIRLLRVSPQGLRWEIIPESRPGIMSALHWSRYLTPAEVDLSFLDK